MRDIRAIIPRMIQVYTPRTSPEPAWNFAIAQTYFWFPKLDWYIEHFTKSSSLSEKVRNALSVAPTSSLDLAIKAKPINPHEFPQATHAKEYP